MTWTGMPPNAKDWVDIAPVGSAGTVVPDWRYDGGTASGTITFPQGLAAASQHGFPGGNYVARLFLNDTYTAAVETAPVLIGSIITTDAAIYAPDAPITVNWIHLPGTPGDRVALAPVGAAPGVVTSFAFTDQSKNGSQVFADGVATPGTYVARTFAPDTDYISGQSASFIVTTGVATTPPPQDVHAIANSDAQITVSWDAVPDATAYHALFRLQGDDTFQQFTSVDGSVVSVVATTLQPGSGYDFVVTAVAAGGESVPSAIASATTFPAGLQGYWSFDERTGSTAADSSGYGRNATLSSAGFSTDRPPVTLLGNRSTLNVSGDPASQATIAPQPTFRFADATFALSAWVKFASAIDTDIIGMRAANCGALGWKLGQDAAHGLNISGGGGTISFGASLTANAWTHVAFSFDATSGQLTMYINGLRSASSAYSAENEIASVPLTVGHVGGCAGGAVLVDELHIFSRTLAASEVAALGAVPPAPTLTIAAPSATVEVLTWTAVANASRYFVYKGTAPGNEVFLTSVAGSSLSFNAQSLAPLTQYSWFVRAEVGALDSPSSNEVVRSTPDLPPEPGNVTATAQLPSSAALSWSAVTGATAYRIYQSSGGGPFALVQSVDGSTTSQVIANLASGSYQFEVAAEDSGQNQGHLSAPASVTLP